MVAELIEDADSLNANLKIPPRKEDSGIPSNCKTLIKKLEGLKTACLSQERFADDSDARNGHMFQGKETREFAEILIGVADIAQWMARATMQFLSVWMVDYPNGEPNRYLFWLEQLRGGLEHAADYLGGYSHPRNGRPVPSLAVQRSLLEAESGKHRAKSTSTRAKQNRLSKLMTTSLARVSLPKGSDDNVGTPDDFLAKPTNVPVQVYSFDHKLKTETDTLDSPRESEKNAATNAWSVRTTTRSSTGKRDGLRIEAILDADVSLTQPACHRPAIKDACSSQGAQTAQGYLSFETATGERQSVTIEDFGLLAFFSEMLEPNTAAVSLTWTKGGTRCYKRFANQECRGPDLAGNCDFVSTGSVATVAITKDLTAATCNQLRSNPTPNAPRWTKVCPSDGVSDVSTAWSHGQSMYSPHSESIAPTDTSASFPHSPLKEGSSDDNDAQDADKSYQHETNWWKFISLICPVCNFPINALPYPPYKLRLKSGKRVLVDGLFLVVQVLSTFVFEVCGAELTVRDMETLDAHLKRCNFGRFRLSEAVALARSEAPEAQKQLNDIRKRATSRLDELKKAQCWRRQQLSVDFATTH